MIGRGLVLVAALFAAGASTPAIACSVIASPRICDGGAACTPAIIAQLQRERAQRAAIEYGRAIGQAINARLDSPALDRVFDLTHILMPAVLPPVEVDDGSGGGCGPESIGDPSGGEPVSLPDFFAAMRTRFGLADNAPLDRHVTALVAQRDACSDEARRGLAVYLRQVLTADEIGELWNFLVPRAGAEVPADGAAPLRGGTLVLRSGGGIAVDGHDARAHVEARRERAAEYLNRHDNGIKVMSAVRQYWAARVAPLIDRPAELCPAADAAMAAFVRALP